MTRFENRIALVTGAAQGIGFAITEQIAAEGAKVYGADVNLDGMAESAEKLKAKGYDVTPLRLDVSDRTSCEEGVNGILEKNDRLELLVNNAGITRDSLLMRMKPEDWDLVLKVNLNGAFNLSQFALKPMMSQRFGRIVNVASVVGLMGNPGQANYVASKAGLIGLTKVTAKELASRNITCNAVAPGFIVSAMTEKLNEKQVEQMKAIIPMRRMGEPVDIARAVAFLLSEDASYITGQVLSINGGMYM
jgi:3-oxoacyl-[acyl-carrier protein] reductase